MIRLAIELYLGRAVFTMNGVIGTTFADIGFQLIGVQVATNDCHLSVFNNQVLMFLSKCQKRHSDKEDGDSCQNQTEKISSIDKYMIEKERIQNGGYQRKT